MTNYGRSDIRPTKKPKKSMQKNPKPTPPIDRQAVSGEGVGL